MFLTRRLPALPAIGVVDDAVGTGTGGGGRIAVATIHCPSFLVNRPSGWRAVRGASPAAVPPFDLLVDAVLRHGLYHVIQF